MTGLATTRRDRWTRLRRWLWQPPRPHGEQPAERVVGPLELFYDLAVVVLVGQDAHRLAGHLTWPGLGQFTVVFTLVWIAWTNGSLHHELHGRELIVLGETLTGVVTGLAAQPVSGLTLSVGLVAVVVGFGAWWTYFDLAGHRHPRPERTASLQWMLGHLPLTAAIAAMGAAMVSLVGHAHDARTSPATAWVLCAGAAVVLTATMLVSASLQAWPRHPGLYRPLARTSAAAACLGVGAARPAPLLLGLALVLLLAIPWALAVTVFAHSKFGEDNESPGDAS